MGAEGSRAGFVDPTPCAPNMHEATVALAPFTENQIALTREWYEKLRESTTDWVDPLKPWDELSPWVQRARVDDYVDGVFAVVGEETLNQRAHEMRARVVDAQAAKRNGRLCPDAGTCHHECPLDACFRVHCCEPLSDVFPDDEWPEAIRLGFKDGGHL